MIYLSKEDLLYIHKKVIDHYGNETGILDEGKLNQCLTIPQQYYYNTEIYTSIESKAAAYLYYITVLHPFVDGNKRVAFLSTLLFLKLHNLRLTANQRECINFVLSIAEGQETIESVISWIKDKITQ